MNEIKKPNQGISRREISKENNKENIKRSWAKTTVSYDKTDSDGIKKHYVEEKYSEDYHSIESGDNRIEGVEYGRVRSSAKTKNAFNLSDLVAQEAAAVDFVNSQVEVIVKEKQPKEGEVVAEGVWLEWAASAIWELIREKALVFITKTLEEIKSKSTEWAVQLAAALLDKIQDFLWNKYKECHSPEEQEHLKEKIVSNFPDSQLAKKLQNETNE